MESTGQKPLNEGMEASTPSPATDGGNPADGHPIIFATPTNAKVESSPAPANGDDEPPILRSFDIEGVAEYIKSGKARNIICMCGAGISVSAGIPDFRTPGTGLYSQLEKYNLPRPEAVFDISYFRSNPDAFFLLAKELFPGQYKPTPTHYFMKLLHDKGLLLRCFTQNIDSLESEAGLPRDAVIAAHGNFDSAHCIDCGREVPISFVKECIMEGRVCRCTCNSLVKPDIVFFGEALPESFAYFRRKDFPKCDLLIVMGTSLVVHPFASLIDDVSQDVPRLLMNREVVGQAVEPLFNWLRSSTPETERKKRRLMKGFQFDPEFNYRDALFLGDCDDGVKQLADLLGWGQDLQQLVGGTAIEQQDEMQGQDGSTDAGTVERRQGGESGEVQDVGGCQDEGEVRGGEMQGAAGAGVLEQLGSISLND